jgi:hypothetical protein
MMNTTAEILREELEQLKSDIIKHQEDAGKMVSGKTAAGYEVAVESDRHGWLEGYPYVGVLETGRKPGKVPKDFKEIIRRWILAKGLQYQDDRDLNRMAASIAWVIHKEGTVLHRTGKREDIFGTPLKDFSGRLARRLSVFYASQISDQIYKTWQQ